MSDHFRGEKPITQLTQEQKLLNETIMHALLNKYPLALKSTTLENGTTLAFFDTKLVSLSEEDRKLNGIIAFNHNGAYHIRSTNQLVNPTDHIEDAIKLVEQEKPTAVRNNYHYFPNDHYQGPYEPSIYIFYYPLSYCIQHLSDQLETHTVGGLISDANEKLEEISRTCY